MSAYLVESYHIAYLVRACCALEIVGQTNAFYYEHAGQSRQFDTTDTDTLDRIERLLWEANRDGIKERYPDADDMWDYEYEPPAGRTWTRLDPVQVIKSIRCYQYQACESSTWIASEARSITDTLLIHAATKVAGYEDAEWGAPEPDRRLPV